MRFLFAFFFWCIVAFATEAQAKTQIANAIRFLNNHKNNMATATTGYLALEDAFNQALFTEYKGEVGNALGAIRASMNGPLFGGPALLAPLFREYAGVIGSAPEQDVVSNMKRIYQYYIDNTLSVLTRGFTFGSPTLAAGAVGNGTLNRLNVDENNKNIDSQYPDSKTCRCIADEHTGAPKHQELFEIMGSQKEIDELRRVGSSAYGQIRALSERDVEPFLSNPSFENYSGTSSAPTAITDWTVTTAIGNFSIDTANTYRDYDGVGTSASLKWAAAANDTVTQNVTTRRANFKRGVPYYMQLAWSRDRATAGDGTLTFTVGNVNVAVVAGAQTGWNILRIVIGQNNWPTQFDLNTLNVSVARTGATVGNIHVDDIIIAPFTPFDNSWYAMVGGSTKFLVKDKFTWSDSVGTEGIIQHFLWRFFNVYLPSVTTAPTFAEPASP